MSGDARAPLRPYLLSRLPFVALTVSVRFVGASQRLVGSELGGYAVVLICALAFVEPVARAVDVESSTRLGMPEVSLHLGDDFLVDVVREAILFGD